VPNAKGLRCIGNWRCVSVQNAVPIATSQGALAIGAAFCTETQRQLPMNWGERHLAPQRSAAQRSAAPIATYDILFDQ